MITRLIWRESWMNNEKDSFWVECTDQEVIDHIYPLKSDADFMKEINFNRGRSKINKTPNESIYTNFFLISVDLTEVLSFNWVYPYAGMWNVSNPFEEIEAVHFDRLEQLEKIHQQVEKEAQEKLRKEIDNLKGVFEWVEDNHFEIIDNIEQESIDVYNFLKKEFASSRANENLLFQFVYKNYYRIENAGLTSEFKKEYFNILEEYRKGRDLDYKAVLDRLYTFRNSKNQKTVQFSFVSKMFHTIDNSSVVYDKEVASVFSISNPYYEKCFDRKVDKYLDHLYRIERGYILMIENNLIPLTSRLFDMKFPNNALSDIKKMDFIFWSAGKVKSRMAKSLKQ